VKTEQVQYYYRAVDARLSAAPASLFSPSNGYSPERAKTRPLYACSTNSPISNGRRFFDILLLDALYAQAPGSSWPIKSDGIWSSA